ncbi:MAG: hypothetical protein Q7J24_12255 [Desulfomicrobium sp.]|nr:hypothetical protein [Desulfomicrobium sp.]
MKFGLGNPLGEVARLLVECDPNHPAEKFPAGTLLSGVEIFGLHPRSGQELLPRGIVESAAKQDAQEAPGGRSAGEVAAAVYGAEEGPGEGVAEGGV